MKAIFLLLFVALIQAPSPVPRQATDNTRADRQAIKKNPSANQNPPASAPAAENPVEAQAQRGQTEKPHESHEQVTVVVQQPTSGWEKAYVIITGLLAIIGGIGVAAAYRTLKAIEAQSNLMREQSDIARQRENPKLRIEFSPVDLALTDSPDMILIDCKVQNYGGSAAFVAESVYECWIAETDGSKTGQRHGVPMNLPEVLVPGRPDEPIMFLPDTEKIVSWTLWNRDDARVESIRKGGKAICIQGFVVYDNIFNERWMLGFKRRFTVRYLGHGLSTFGEWSREGDADNYERRVEHPPAKF